MKNLLACGKGGYADQWGKWGLSKWCCDSQETKPFVENHLL